MEEKGGDTVKHRQKSRQEIIAELMVQNAQKPMTAEDVIAIGRKGIEDRNIQIGHNIATGLILVELMEAYGWEQKDLQQLLDIHWEYLHTYQSNDPEDMATTMGYFEKLKETTGYDVLDGGNSLWEQVQKGEVKIDETDN